MLSTVHLKKYKVIPLIGTIALLVVIVTTVLVNQETVRPTQAATCTGVPGGFNPVTVTNALLATYGLPPRPSLGQPKLYQTWLKVVSHAKHRVCTTGTSTMRPPSASIGGSAANIPLAYRANQGTNEQFAPLVQSSTNSANVGASSYAAYVVNAANITSVAGSFSVPAHQDTNKGVVTSGVAMGDLTMELGVQSDSYAGTILFYAYNAVNGTRYANPAVVGAISAGHEVSVIITYSPQGGGGTVTGTITDDTNGAYYSDQMSAAGAGNAAIAGESRWNGPNLYNFGTVPFTGYEVTIGNGDQQPFSKNAYSGLTMTNAAGGVLASPVGPDATGAGFSVNFKAPA